MTHRDPIQDLRRGIPPHFRLERDERKFIEELRRVSLGLDERDDLSRAQARKLLGRLR